MGANHEKLCWENTNDGYISCWDKKEKGDGKEECEIFDPFKECMLPPGKSTNFVFVMVMVLALLAHITKTFKRS